MLQWLDHVVWNYERLTDDKKARVPDNSYKNANEYFEITKYNNEERMTIKEKNKNPSTLLLQT